MSTAAADGLRCLVSWSILRLEFSSSMVSRRCWTNFSCPSSEPFSLIYSCSSSSSSMTLVEESPSSVLLNFKILFSCSSFSIFSSIPLLICSYMSFPCENPSCYCPLLIWIYSIVNSRLLIFSILISSFFFMILIWLCMSPIAYSLFCT